MSGRFPLGPIRTASLVALMAMAGLAHAQWCNAPLPKPGTKPDPGPEKFSLIASQCDVLDAPAIEHRAQQLKLYDGSRSVTIEGEREQPAPAAAPAPKPIPKYVDIPLDKNGKRVLALAPALLEAARQSDLDPLLLHAIAHVESRHNATAISPAGARGLMQVMPATAKRFGVNDPEQTLLDAQTNLRASAAYLRTLRTRFNDDLTLMLAAYNAGEGAVDKYGRSVPPYPETQAYVRDVLAVYRRLTDSFEVTATGLLVARGDIQ